MNQPPVEMSKLLRVMIEHDASDLYITAESPPMYRINGSIKPAGTHLFQPEETEALAYSILSDKLQREFQSKNELNTGLFYAGLGRFRVNVFRQRGSIALVIRQIKTKIATIDDLQLPPVLKDISMTKRGLVLMVGATGSGKSTSQAAMIDYRNQESAGHIITIEDPIEFVHNHKKSIISQREVGLDTESYDIALENAMRQAPDVVIIGEIRTRKAMEAALTCAETGHLCLATLHSNNAYQAMERVMSFFPLDHQQQIYLMLSLNLRAIISQRLVKTVNNSRAAAIEVLLDSPRVKDLILKAQVSDLKEAMEKSSNLGMQTFDEALYNLYKAGTISLDEALKHADSQNNLRLRVKLSEEGAFDKPSDLLVRGSGATKI